jgi:hypothetical protein
MFLKGRLVVIWDLLFNPNMADFVIIQTLRWQIKKRVGKCDKETVVKWMESKMPHTWEALLRSGVKIKDEHFV